MNIRQTILWKAVLLTMLLHAQPSHVSAQLASNPDKFLGNITTRGRVEYDSEPFCQLWNQITCENESKWASVEGRNDNFRWHSDQAYNYAHQHAFPFKFHTLIWGAQYPKWIEEMSPEKRLQEITQWMDAVKERYPDLQLIDVVNEAVKGHQKGTHYLAEALGGAGHTGYDWIIKAFEMAYERWPDAILIYNDYNTFQWNTREYIHLVRTLRNAGAPIDAYGCQGHDLTNIDPKQFANRMQELQAALQMPMYCTEYDIATSDDSLQLQRYKEQIPLMWEADYMAGLTFWGYHYGCTWTKDGNSGIIREGHDRPAMTWLRQYMQTAEAKKAKSPFPGMKKEASIYIKPSTLTLKANETATIDIRVRMRTKRIRKVELYVDGQRLGKLKASATGLYRGTFASTLAGTHELKAVVTTKDNKKWTRLSEISVTN